MSKAVLFFAWKRPRYLRVTLESLTRNKSVKDWDVIVSLDGDSRGDFDFVEKHFGYRLIRQSKHLNNLWHVMKGLEDSFICGHEKVLFFDEDVILRRDVLDYADTLKHEGYFTYGMFNPNKPPDRSAEIPVSSGFCPLGNLIFAEEWKPLREYVYAYKWENLPKPWVNGVTLNRNWDAYDAIFCRYVLDAKKLCAYAPVNYVLHFGITGVDFRESAFVDDTEKVFFAGDPSTWIENILSVANASEHGAFQPKPIEYV